MRTVRNSSRLLRGGGNAWSRGVCSGGCLLWGVSALGAGCLVPRGGVCSGGCLVSGGCLFLGGACSWGVSAPRGVYSGGVGPGGCLLWGPEPGGYVLWGGAWSHGVSARGVPAPGGVVSQHALRQPPPCGQTDRCKNIFFATSLWTVRTPQECVLPIFECSNWML